MRKLIYLPTNTSLETESLDIKIIIYNPTEQDIIRVQELVGDNYTIEDDGLPETKSDKERIAELEEALALLLSGVTE